MEKIEAFSQKGKLTRQLHKLIFRNKKANVNTQVQAIRQSDLDYDFEKFQGKIIRNIHIETFDPFGFSIHDSTRFPTKKVEVIGNRMHLKTKPFTVRALFFLKKISHWIRYNFKNLSVCYDLNDTFEEFRSSQLLFPKHQILLMFKSKYWIHGSGIQTVLCQHQVVV